MIEPTVTYTTKGWGEMPHRSFAEVREQMAEKVRELGAVTNVEEPDPDTVVWTVSYEDTESGASIWLIRDAIEEVTTEARSYGLAVDYSEPEADELMVEALTNAVQNITDAGFRERRAKMRDAIAAAFREGMRR